MEKLPKAVSEETFEVLGVKLKAVVLDDGRRIFEMNDDLRDLLFRLGFETTTPEGASAAPEADPPADPGQE